jgi:Uma2 family endonuclease
MSAFPSSTVPDAAPLWRMSVDRYHEMIEAGVLGPDDRVELLEGLLVDKMTIDPPHRIATRLTRLALESAVPEGWYVEEQKPLTFADSEPEPDVAVIRGDTRQYRDRHPGPADVMLVVEVSDASLRRDRKVKKRIYARAGIPLYWIVNLVERCVEVYSESGDGDYARCEIYHAGQNAPTPFGAVPVSALLP